LAGGLFFLGLAHRLSWKTAAPLLAATAIAVMPAIHLALIDDTALGSRILYLPAVSFCALLGCMVGSLPNTRARGALLFVVTAGFSLGLLNNLKAWYVAANAADRVCTAAAENGLPPDPPPRRVNGVFFFANGFPECVEMKQEMARD
jgi:hypothetical protein